MKENDSDGGNNNIDGEEELNPADFRSKFAAMQTQIHEKKQKKLDLDELWENTSIS